MATRFDLSDRQKRLLVRLLDGPATTAALAAHVEAPAGATRKVLSRLESRALLSGEGAGAKRTWTLTEHGSAQAKFHSPDAEKTPGRPYTILEQMTLRELYERLESDPTYDENDVTLYVVASQVTARNTEHAFRQVARQMADRVEDAEGVVVPLLAIDEKRWRVTPITVKNNLSVSIG